MQIVGLNAVKAGAPIAGGVTGEYATLTSEFKTIKQPYKGGVTLNFAPPSKNEFYREGEDSPFYSEFDPTTATKEIAWSVADWDDETLEFYFGKDEPESGKLYEGEGGFSFESNSGSALVFARLKFVAVPSGALNSSDPLVANITATVLAPENGGRAWKPMAIPKGE